MKMNFLKLMFTAAIAISVLFVTSCCDAPADEATDATQTEVTDDVVSDEPAVEDVESHEGHNHDVIAEATYQCPMKCEADKTYTEVGSCPECKMDLEALKAEEK